MADIEQIITNSIESAQESGSLPDAIETESSGGADETSGESGGATEAGGESDAGVGASTASADVAVEGTTPAKGDWSDDDLKDFEALGIKPPEVGKKDNRMPYTRHLKTALNLVRKERARLEESHTKALSERETKYQAVEAELQRAKELDQLAQTDPDKYVKMLAVLYPEKYQRFLQTGEVKPVAPTLDPGDPEPQPDVKFEDGSVGFSPTQLGKLNAWNRRQAVKEAQEENRKMLAPILQERAALNKYNEMVPVVQANIARAKEVWGEKFFDEHADAILKAVTSDNEAAKKANRAPTPFADTVSKVLVPKMNERMNTQRASILEELKKAPAAARSTAPVASKVSEPDTPRTTEQIVADATERLLRSQR